MCNKNSLVHYYIVILVKFVLVISALFLFLILIGQLLFTAQINWAHFSVTYFFTFINSSVILFVLLSIIFRFLRKKIFYISGKTLLYISALIILIISAFFIFVINPKLSVDAEEVMNVAQDWVNTGNVEGWYLKIHPYQFGLISLLRGLLIVFKDENAVILFFRIINVIALLVIDVVIYFVAKIITNDKNAGYATVIFSLLLFPEMLTTYVYGDLIGYAFAFVSLWLCLTNIDSFKLSKFVGQLIFLLLAIYFRLPTIIIGIAELIIAFIFFKQYKLFSTILLFFTLIFGNNLGEIILEQFYQVPTTNIPLIARTAMSFDYYGMGIREPGWNTSYALDITDKCLGDVNCIQNYSLTYLKEVFQLFISHPTIGVNFMARKFYSQWLIPDFEGYGLLRIDDFTQHQLFYLGNSIADSYFIFFSTIWMKAIFIFVVFTAFISILKNINTKDKYIFSLALILCGCFSYYLIGEVKARYVIPFVFIMIPLCALWFDNEVFTLSSKFAINKATILLTILVLFSSKLLWEYKHVELPVVYKETFTDTATELSLQKDKYYQIPIKVTDDLRLSNISIYLSVDKCLDNTYLQVDIFDENQLLLTSASTTFDYQEVGYIWKSISIEGNLEPGNYTIQINSSNTDDVGLNIILGEQYSYIDQENIKINGFDTEYKANYKIYKNHY